MKPKKKLIEIDINIKGITVKNEAKKKEIVARLRKEMREKARQTLEEVEGVIKESAISSYRKATSKSDP